jgi:pSer/pThr/pTyr-binding forkhead associated (FHA) protein
MKAQVLFRERRSKVQPFSLKGAECVLGRDPGIAVPVTKEGVSRRHARILLEEGEYVLEDLGSTNGTFLNGQQVARDRLRHLDVIGLGKAVDLIFLLRPDEAKTLKKVGVIDAALIRDAPGATPDPLPTGEVTLGRATACNIVSNQGAVSKIHCRIVRTQSQVSVEDLGSANGTFVNGERTMTAVLQDGDTLGLAGVEVFKVQIQLGEITSSSGIHEGPAVPRTGAYRRFSPDWKTRYEWDPAERAEIEKLQQQLRLEDAQRQAPPRSSTTKQSAVMPPKKPAPPASKTPAPAAAAAAKPPAAAARPDAHPAAAAVPAAAKSVGPEAPAPAAEPAAKQDEAPPSTPAAAMPSAPPAAPAAPKSLPTSAKGRIVEVRLRGGSIDVGVAETGAHDLGRAKEAALRVPHPTVSRQHARIIISDDRGVAYVQDRGGANGTRLNGVVITEIKLLQDDDTITVGEVDLKVAIRREP